MSSGRASHSVRGTPTKSTDRFLSLESIEVSVHRRPVLGRDRFPHGAHGLGDPKSVAEPSFEVNLDEQGEWRRPPVQAPKFSRGGPVWASLDRHEGDGRIVSDVEEVGGAKVIMKVIIKPSGLSIGEAGPTTISSLHAVHRCQQAHYLRSRKSSLRGEQPSDVLHRSEFAGEELGAAKSD